jgi:hypothetical protein
LSVNEILRKLLGLGAFAAKVGALNFKVLDNGVEIVGRHGASAERNTR